MKKGKDETEAIVSLSEYPFPSEGSSAYRRTNFDSILLRPAIYMALLNKLAVMLFDPIDFYD